MIRRQRTLVLVVVCLAVVAGAAAPVAGDDSPPPPPAAYYGSLTVNGEPANAGVTVTARIDGEARGSLTTEREGAFGGAGAFDGKLQVDGTTDDDGGTVTFYVNGVRADQTVGWQSGDVRRVDLAVTGDVYDSAGGSDDDNDNGGGSQPVQSTERPPPEPDGDDGSGSQPVRSTETPRPDPDDGVERTTVTVNARANETVSVNLTDGDDSDGDGLSDADGDRNVTLDGVDVEVKRDGNVSLSITSSDDPPVGAASLSIDDGTEPFGYISVEHSIPEEDIGNVTFRFRVSKTRLDERGADPSNVVMYRYHGGVWSELPTGQVGETATHYVVTATSPGLSEFATRLKRPRFAIRDARVNASSLLVGEDTEVRVRVENVGGADGSYAVELRVDGKTVQSRAVAVPAGDSRVVTFRQTFGERGTFAIAVNDASVGEVSVTEETTTAVRTDRPSETAPSTETESPGFGLFSGAVALLVVTCTALLGRRG